MLLTLLVWLYVLPLAYIYGLLTYDIVGRAVKQDPRAEQPFSILVIVGLAVISGLSAYLFLFMKLGLVANLIILGIALIYLFRQQRLRLSVAAFSSGLRAIRQAVSQAPGWSFWVMALGLLLILRSSIAFFHADSGGYHVPYIEWAQRYALTPGIGNANSRFAFNSMWLLLSTLFNFSFLLTAPIYSLNCLLLFVMLIATGQNLRLVMSGNASLANRFQALLILPGAYLVFNATASSPSTDLAPAIAIYTVITMLIQYIDQQSQPRDTQVLAVIISLLAGYAIALKLSALPLAIVPIYCVVQEFRKVGRRAIWLGLLPNLLFFIPYLAINIVQSGYLIYPLPSINVFNFDWKMPLAKVIHEKRVVEAWAKMHFYQGTEADVLDQGFMHWFQPWVVDNLSSHELRFLAAAIVIFLICASLRLRVVQRLGQTYGVIYGVLTIGFIFWFITAPDVRFGYGMIWSATLMLLATASQSLNLPRSSPLRPALATAAQVATMSGSIAGPKADQAIRATAQRSAPPLVGARPKPPRRLGAVGLALCLLASITVIAFYQLHQKYGMVGIQTRLTRTFGANFLIAPAPVPSDTTLMTIAIGAKVVYAPTNDDQGCWASAFPCVPCPVAIAVCQDYISQHLQLRGESFQAGWRWRP